MKYHTIDGDIEEENESEMPESTIFDKIISINNSNYRQQNTT